MVEGAYPVPRLDIFMKRESRQNRSVGRKFKSVKVQTVVSIVRMHIAHDMYSRVADVTGRQ